MSQTAWENLASWWSLAAAGAAFVVLAISIQRNWRLIDRVERAFFKIASRIAIYFILIPAVSFAVNLIITLQHGIPKPLIHDEFSYLLAADTFAQGRLTNPTPPMWEAFETPQELMRPTYMSKYPPGQGIALAIGRLATGEPIVGVWLSTAAACLAIYWMLLAFVSPRWALVGGTVAVLCPELGDWSRVYWGGSVAVLGGAMLVGAWGRLMRSPSVGASIVLGISMVILANSRPFEGLVLCLPLLLSFAVKSPGYMSGTPKGGAFPPIARVFVPAGLILLIALPGMGWFNFRITGSALRMPFMEYAGQYDVYPKFWFLPKHTSPVYHNESLKWVALEFEKGQFDELRTMVGCIRISLSRLRDLIFWQAKPIVLLLPFAIGMFVGRDRRLRWIRAAVGLSAIGLLAESFVLPHYAAPILPLVLLLTILGWRWMYSSPWQGRAIACSIGIGFLVGAIMIAAQPISRDSLITGHAALAESDALRTGRHLVFVGYAPGYAFHNEYVFNDADIAASRIIWARSLESDADHRLVEQFPGRTIWKLTVGTGLNLNPYSP